MKWMRRVKGGMVGMIGFMLSPLSWWNDMFVNIPLALAFAWLVSLPWPGAFTVCFVLGYWLTNVLGLVLLRRGAQELVSGQRSPFSRRELIKDLAVALVYTALILLLVKSKVLQPIQHYFHTKA